MEHLIYSLAVVALSALLAVSLGGLLDLSRRKNIVLLLTLLLLLMILCMYPLLQKSS